MSSVAQILQQMAEHAGNVRRQRGALIGNTIADLSQLPGQIMADRAQQQIARQKAQRQQWQDQRLMAEDARQAAGDAPAEAVREAERREQAAAQEIMAVYVAGSPNDPATNDLPAAEAKARELGRPDYVLKLRKIDADERARAKLPAPVITQTDPTKDTYENGVLKTPGVAKVEKVPAPVAGSFGDYIARETEAVGRPLTPADVLRAKEKFEKAGRVPTAPRDEGAPVSVMGPDGRPILVRRSEAYGKTPAAGSEKPSSGVQKRALAFFNRASQADKELEALEPSIQTQGLAGQAYQAVAPNFMQTQQGQSYGAAQRAFTEARLRKDSGAAIPDAEFENDRKTYFAQPGDSKETLEQKRRGRAAILASLGFESGQALGEFLGDPAEARTLVESYKTRSAKDRGDAPKSDPLGLFK
jgi:hypothetical protein